MSLKPNKKTLAGVPAAEEKSVSEKKAPFAVVEAYKLIRTNLLFVLAQEKGKTVAVSSAGANEGKSTTTVNIAIAFSQLGGKVLLVDADLRRSTVHKKLRIENKDGLSDVLVGFSDFEDAVQHLNANLDVLTAGSTPPNPSELLGSQRFEEFVSLVEQKYDYILIDTPPINIVSDALVISQRTAGLVLIVRDGVTPYDAIEHTFESAKFAGINILGTIMNGVNAKASKRYSYRKYGSNKYGYGYGYGSYGGYGNYDSSPRAGSEKSK